MKTKPLTFRTMPPEWRDSSKWREVDLSALADGPRARFDRLSAGIGLYLRSGHLRAAALAACCSPAVLINQLNRCVILGPDGNVLGWAGLIENLRLKEYERQEPLPSGAAQAVHGSAGAFRRFLREHPRLRALLDDAIFRGVGTKKVRSLKTTQKSVWALFVRECIKEIGADEYPLNSATRGRRSVERYVKWILDTNPKALPAWIGIDASKALGVGNGKFSFALADMPLDMTGADAHKLDAVGVIVLDGPAGPQAVPVKRIWIYAHVDFESRAVLGYAVSIRAEPTASQLEAAVDMSQRPWQKRDLKMAGVRYRDGAGFPCGCVDGLAACSPGAIRLDNGMPGYSRITTHRIRRKLGCALSFGAVGAWWQNAVTERVFRQLEQCGFQRLPSSTGSNANDPMRGNAAGQAVKHQILWEELVDLIDVAFANYNAEPTAGLGHRSPLDVLRDCFNPLDARLQPCLPVPPTVTTPELGVSVETCIVRGQRRPGKYRRAYVQIDKGTYTNDELSSHIDWVGKPLTVHVKNGDMRTVKAFLWDGQAIGELTVRERGWRRTKHTRDMRKAINRLRDAGELPWDCEDLVAAYMVHLAGNAALDAKNRPGKISKAATQLAETVRATGQGVPSIDGVPRLRLVTAPPARPIPAHIKRPSWG